MPQPLFFSIVIPVYNRPEEIRELLQSLTTQTYTHFEVIIVEDGSTNRCKQIAEAFSKQLDITYVYKENSGQGFSRNAGFAKARGDYFIVFDSDCLIPAHYLNKVHTSLREHWLDAYGGPDKAHPSFTVLQKAISYSMTSPFTTGGIRGNKRHAGRFRPRSFNMGISRRVYEQTGGFKITRMGEDIEFSIRINEQGFQSGLIPEAFVYHKRRTSLKQFFKQLHFFGRARINIGRFYPEQVKWIHLLPSFFVVALAFYISLPLWQLQLFRGATIFGGLWCALIAIHATYNTGQLKVGLASIATSFVQLTAYGIGFLQESLKR